MRKHRLNSPSDDFMDSSLERDTSKKSTMSYSAAIRALYPYVKPHRKSFIYLYVCIVFAVAAELIQPLLVMVAIDDYLMLGDTNFGIIALLCSAYLGLACINLIFSYLQNNVLQRAGQGIVGNIRKDLFLHISKQSMAYFDKVPRGSLITHVSSDTEAINQFFSQVLLSIFRDGLTLICILLLMFQLDATLALYSLLVIPILVAIAILFRGYMLATYQIARTSYSRLISFIAENLAGMNLIQSFHQAKVQQTQFMDRNRTYLKANLREVRTMVLFNRTYDIVGNLAIAILVWLGGRAVLDTTINFGILYAFIIYMRMFFQPISSITQQWNMLQAAMVSIHRIWSIFSIAPSVTEAKETMDIDIRDVKGKIDFANVQFGYTVNIPVIHHLNVNIQPGEMVGIVGTTGAGKSSLISLLCRFYDVTQGSVCIDGIDIRTIPQATLHRMIGLVQQEPYIYSGNIIDNIRMFDDTISRETVMHACARVGATSLIEQLKDGYDTMLSEQGSGLSAGERQLISFARIMVFQPKILILDEATANVDSHTEQFIQSALHIAAEGRTTIVIAHRLSTIVQADRILVMRSGEIVEEGTHTELIAKQGYYAQLHRHSLGKGSII
jgi:ATP-binding cassette subfamily B multidrug efflux pump